MRVINDKIYPRGKWMSFTNTTRQVVQFAFSAGRDSVAVLVWRGDRAVARISKSAVSRVSNPQTLRRLQSRGTGDGSADWKSAIQQVGNLLPSKGAKQIRSTAATKLGHYPRARLGPFKS